jgi:hypothetical protein
LRVFSEQMMLLTFSSQDGLDHWWTGDRLRPNFYLEGRLLPITYCPLRMACGLLSLLPIAYELSIAYCLLPIAYGLISFSGVLDAFLSGNDPFRPLLSADLAGLVWLERKTHRGSGATCMFKSSTTPYPGLRKQSEKNALFPHLNLTNGISL